MNAQKYNAAIRLTTISALKSGLSIAEAIGVLELAKANIVKMAIAKESQPQPDIVAVAAPLPPGLNG